MKNDKRGLASADEKTKKRVAHEGGVAAQRSGNAHDIAGEASKGGRAAQESGHAHQLNDKDRAKGGQNSHRS